LNVLSVCTGIGGLDLGLQRAGMTIVGQVEIDPWCREKLQNHWPEVPKHDDLRTAAEWWRSGHRPPVHLVAGGVPCQPVSVAGLKLGADDPRWLWPATRTFLAEIRPVWAVIENVPGLRTRGLAAILGDFDRLGYRARAGYISACEMGATHPRRRLLTLAHAKSLRCGQGRPWGSDLRPAPREAVPPQDVADADRLGTVPAGRGWWESEPGVARMAHGLPGRVDRVRALGNAVVPQMGQYIGEMIMSVYTASCEDRPSGVAGLFVAPPAADQGRWPVADP
jgi:DNA (cytosine-5)-methyltransferase 1